jgi:hypothetical protein
MLLTLSDSSWQADCDNGRGTILCLVYYVGEVVDYLSTLISAESEYNKACKVCQSTTRIRMSVNELEQVETGGKHDKTIYILLDNKRAVEMSATFKTQNILGTSLDAGTAHYQA